MALGVLVAAVTLLLDDGPAARGGASRPETASLAVLGLTSIAAYLALIAWLHVVDTERDPVGHAVSDYAVGPHGGLFRAGLYLSSLGVLALAVGLEHGVGTPPVESRYLCYLLLIPVARIGMALFPTTLEGERLNATAVVHYACAIAAFTLTYLVVADVTPVLRSLSATGSLSGPLHVCSSAVGPELGAVVVTMFRPLRRFFGLFERLFLLTTNVWFVLLALLLISRAG